MHRIIFGILLICIIHFSVSAQTNIDSLQTIIEKGTQSEKLDALLEISTIYLSINVDTSLIYANKSLELSKEIQDRSREAKALRKRGVANYYLSNIDSALVDFKQSRRIYNKLKMRKEEAGLLSNIGIIETDLSNYQQALEDLNAALHIYQDINDSVGICTVYGSIGAIYLSVSSYEKALNYFQQSYDIAIKAGDEFSKTSALHNMGLVYHSWGEFEKAVSRYQEAMKMARERDDQRTVGHITLNIGVVYYDWGNYDKALEYYQEALSIHEQMGDLPNMTNSLNNMAIIYEHKKERDKALDLYMKALSLAKDAGRKVSVGTAYLNLGTFYTGEQNYDKAIEYFRKSLELRKEIEDHRGVATALISLGNVYSELKQQRKAINYYKSGMNLLEALNSLNDLKETYGSIAMAYKDMGDYKKAFQFYEKYTLLKDSIFNKEAHQNITDIQTKYETEQKEKEIELLNKEKLVDQLKMQEQDAAIKKQRILIIAFIVVFALILVFSIIVYRLYNRIRTANHVLARQNKEIREQKAEIESQRDDITYKNAELEQKNEEITAQRDEIEAQRDMVMQQKEQIESIHLEVTQSIDYAMRIQQAVLPAQSLLTSKGLDHFILFKPKDKVSGDFYWWTEIEDFTVITAADCTGHGVPGAFMSLLGISFLREIVMKEYITHPGVILRRLRKEVVKSLSQTGKEGTQKDGMDMSLLVINHKEQTFAWAGANNPLWIVRADDHDDYDDMASKIEVIKADKMPIGIYERMDKFQNHELQLRNNDKLYMFSDGFPDQFGGPKGKKYKQKAFKRLIASTSHLSMVEQGAYLEQELKKWMQHDGEHFEQVDDITVLGISVSI